MGNVHTVGRNEVLVITSGGRLGTGGTRKYVTGGGWCWTWCCDDIQRLSLDVITFNVRFERVDCCQGVPLTITGVALVKVRGSLDGGALAAACEQFLGRTVERMQETIQQLLDGHVRAVVGTMSLEAVYQDRRTVATLLQERAAVDLERIGMEMVSFNVQDVIPVEYLDALVKSKASSQLNRDGKIDVCKTSETERDRRPTPDVTPETHHPIIKNRAADDENEYEMQHVKKTNSPVRPIPRTPADGSPNPSPPPLQSTVEIVFLSSSSTIDEDAGLISKTTAGAHHQEQQQHQLQQQQHPADDSSSPSLKISIELESPESSTKSVECQTQAETEDASTSPFIPLVVVTAASSNNLKRESHHTLALRLLHRHQRKPLRRFASTTTGAKMAKTKTVPSRISRGN